MMFKTDMSTYLSFQTNQIGFLHSLEEVFGFDGIQIKKDSVV